VSIVAAEVGRRTVLKNGIGLGVGLSLASTLTFAQDDPASLRPREGDLLVKEGDANREPLSPDAIPVGATQIMAWAMDPADRTVRNGSRLNRVLLLRFDAGQLSADTRSRAAGGVVAYTAICTHTGCEVVEWLAAQQALQCPCHFSQFDPRDGARVVDGPAPRPLPALPLALVDGKLVVAKPYTTRVGFDPA
jgi:rieske iron-sulfur protein